MTYVPTVLFLAALILAVIDLLRPRGLTAWAVALVCVGLLYGVWA